MNRFIVNGIHAGIVRAAIKTLKIGKVSNPILGSILVRAGEIRLFDGEVEVSMPLSRTDGKAAHCLIPAAAFAGKGAVDISYDDKTISYNGISRAALDPLEFPEMPDADVKLPDDIDIIPADLARLAVACAADSTHKYALNGIGISPKNGRIAATDSRALAALYMSKSKAADLILPIIPIKLLATIRAKEANLKYNAKESRYIFSVELKGVGPVSIKGRLIEGNYPDIGHLFPKKSKDNWTISKEFIAGLEKINAFWKSMPKSERMDLHCRLSASGMSAISHNGFGSCSAPFAGPEVKIAFNPEYMADMLAIIPGMKALEFNGETDPIVGRSKAGFILVMPIALKDEEGADEQSVAPVVEKPADPAPQAPEKPAPIAEPIPAPVVKAKDPVQVEKPAAPGKFSVAGMITDRILEMLDKGSIPWKKPWIGGGPCNYQGRIYQGINSLLLGCGEKPSRVWLTFNQVKALKGSVNSGARSMPVVFWKWLTREDDTEFPLLRYYRVFNIADTDLPAPELPEFKINTALDAENPELLLAKMPRPVPISWIDGADRACYSPGQDRISMPAKVQFKTMQALFATLAHEGIHASGHKDRLDRLSQAHFADEKYAHEELTAEIGACMLLNAHGITPEFENSAAYCTSWSSRIKAGKTGVIITAASKAEKAVDYIMGDKNE